jgi:hypothetical protein
MKLEITFAPDTPDSMLIQLSLSFPSTTVSGNKLSGFGDIVVLQQTHQTVYNLAKHYVIEVKYT